MTEDLNNGHRQRLKDKFLQNPDSMLDYEILELILFYSIPRKDVRTLAKLLLKDFGSLAKVLNASLAELVAYDNITSNTHTLFTLIRKTHSYLLLKEMSNKHIISTWSSLLDYLHNELAFKKNEYLKILYLNSKNYLIKEETIAEGSINYINIDIRQIMKKVLALDALSFILVHNHPSGDYSPSLEDIEITLTVKKIASSLSLTLHDHIIIGSSGIYSFKNSNIL